VKLKQGIRGGRSRGILFDPGGTQVATWFWGLGVASDNVVDAYTLLRGLIISKEYEVASLIVMGYSVIIIKEMLGEPSSMEIRVTKVISQPIEAK
jgi:hypothetical protein